VFGQVRGGAFAGAVRRADAFSTSTVIMTRLYQ